jgi:RimJ/RimL family protein N-acetyltransferase
VRTSDKTPFAPITTERLRLVWMSPSFMRASLEGRREEAEAILDARLPGHWPDEPAKRVMEVRVEQMVRRPESGEWLLRAIVERESGTVVGYINFHGPPEEGRAELGYTIFEDRRRRGYATEAIRGMMAWARSAHDVERFVLSISPENEPSLALAAKLGFERIGSQVDPIAGEEWVFELPPPGNGRTAG